MQRHLVDMEAKARVPFERTGQLARKRLDLVVGNDVSAPGVGFEHDTNAVVLIGADGMRDDVPLSDKRAVARAVLDAVVRTRSDQ
jgi:phosphopantothenoylcysteine decarboxylase/phosphopantothenate--cysteine ligase